MVGLADVMQVSESVRTRHLADLHDYQASHLRTRRIALADHCLGAQSSVRLLRWRDDTEARFAMDRVVEYLRTAPENSLGVFDHLGHRVWYRHLLRPGAWVDSMMMYVLTAAQLGRTCRQPWLEQLALRHAERFCEHLQGPSGLFRHAKLLPDRRAPVCWLRGNGWAASCLVGLLETHRHDRLRHAFERQAERLVRFQPTSGLWPTVVDMPGSPAEASGTALVAYALARGARVGLLPPDARRAAWRAWRGLSLLLRRTTRGLTLESISAPSIPSRSLVYRITPRLSGLAYGVGAMLMLAAELASGEDS